MKNMCQKFLLFFLVILQILMCSSCENLHHITDTNPINLWDLSEIGYFQGWDKALCESGYAVGIIDMNSEVSSDDKTIKKRHIDLLTATVSRLSDICKTEIILLDEGSSIDEFFDAVLQMIEKNIKVINISLGRANSFELSETLIKKINDEGVFLICSAGNNANQLLFPAMSNGTISVLATDIYGNDGKRLDCISKKSFSAPGIHVNLFDSYFSGSSLATIYISVICAAYKTINSEYSNDEIIDDLIKSCTRESDYSYGIPQIDELF